MYVYESPKATYANQPNNHLQRYNLPTKLNPCSGIFHDILQAKEVITSLFWARGALPQIPHTRIGLGVLSFGFPYKVWSEDSDEREAESFAPLYTTTLFKLLESAPFYHGIFLCLTPHPIILSNWPLIPQRGEIVSSQIHILQFSDLCSQNNYSSWYSLT